LKRDLKKGSGFFAEGVSPRGCPCQARAPAGGARRFPHPCRGRSRRRIARRDAGSDDYYKDLKDHAGKLDFVDLLLRAHELLKGNIGKFARYFQPALQPRFVDEFQDTDPLQAAILLLLCADDPSQGGLASDQTGARKTVSGGDPKQSIYKFRRADVRSTSGFAAISKSRGVRRIALTKSYRSVRGIQRFVNAAFEQEMSGDETAGQAPTHPSMRTA